MNGYCVVQLIVHDEIKKLYLFVKFRLISCLIQSEQCGKYMYISICATKFIDKNVYSTSKNTKISKFIKISDLEIFSRYKVLSL